MIRQKKNIANLNREQYRAAIREIPHDHDIVLCAISEHGKQDLKMMRLSYIFIEDEDKKEYIEMLKRGLEVIKTGELERLEDGIM